MAPRSTPTAPLSLTDISKYQDAVLENVRALITEAELLCIHSHFGRSFFLSIIAVEETSKVLMLIECAKKINAGENQDWPKVHEMLNNHPAKLRANLMLYRSRRLGGMPPVGGGDYKDALERVTEMNLLKQAALYVWIGEGGPLTTAEHISEDEKSVTAIQLAKLSLREVESAVAIFRTGV